MQNIFLYEYVIENEYVENIVRYNYHKKGAKKLENLCMSTPIFHLSSNCTYIHGMGVSRLSLSRAFTRLLKPNIGCWFVWLIILPRGQNFKTWLIN